ncbi:hypothetical protein BH23GEM10_BH23GEM10_16980 [soil metagenome]
MRYYLPGAPFHITARLHDGERLFAGLESRIVDIVLRTAAQERTTVLAYAVMPNHLHLLVVHGQGPLSTLMQPLLRRVALLVQRTHDRRGHVFERRYRESVCLDPEYARSIVAYIHLNPVRAGLCTDPATYPWTSHNVYCHSGSRDEPASLFLADVAAFLALFADEPARSVAQNRQSYRRYVAWRISADQAAGSELPCAPPPGTRSGNVAWRDRFGGIVTRPPSGGAPERKPAEWAALEDLAESVILDDGRKVSIELLRTNRKIPAHVELRRKLILHALAAGYCGHQVARYLRITTSAVSKVRMAALATAMSPGDE